MGETNPPTDEAVLYVLGELNVPQRGAFERRLAQSEELRASLRELEDGIVALSLASPKRQPPGRVWTGIEKALSRKHTQPVFAPTTLWTGWWRNGWLAAAGCMIGWLLYALWVSRPGPQDTPSTPVISVAAPQQDAPPSNLFSGGTGTIPTQPTTKGDSVLDSTQARGQESSALRWQIAQLSNQMSELAHAVTQQQSLLSEPSRVKFFQLSAVPVENSEMAMAPVSTNLQRALFLAMAREFGWLPLASSRSPDIDSGKDAPSAGSRTTTNTQAGVDFVDLRPTSAPTTNAKDEGSADTESLSNQALAASTTPTNSNPISGFISGTNTVLAFDSSVLPAGSALTFQTMSPSGQFQSLGTAVLGTNPTVVTMPFSVKTWQGMSISVMVSGVVSNTGTFLGQFPPPAANVGDTSR